MGGDTGEPRVGLGISLSLSLSYLSSRNREWGESGENSRSAWEEGTVIVSTAVRSGEDERVVVSQRVVSGVAEGIKRTGLGHGIGSNG